MEQHIVDDILKILKDYDIPGNFIELEITENAIMDDMDSVIRKLQELSSHGITIAIDDFGTGYSSLNMANDKKDESIVKAAVDLAHTLGLQIVAEGVEDEKTMDLLSDMNCDYAQGYYMAKPMPCEDLMSWMQESKWRP